MGNGRVRALRSSLIAAAFGLLAPAMHADQYDPLAELHGQPLALAVPATDAPPIADGAIGAGEWDVAAATCGFLDYVTGDVLDDAPTLFVVRSRQALHFLIITPVPEGHEISKDQTRRDGPVYKDDAVEVFVRPPDGSVRQVVVNARGTLADLRDDDMAWNGRFSVAGWQCDAEGLPAAWEFPPGRYWCAEVELPFAQLGCDPPAPGDVWQANIAADRSGPWCALGDTVGGAFSDAKQFIELRFLAPDSPFAQLLRTGDVGSGELSLGGRLRNPSSSAAEFRVDVDLRREGSYLTKDAYRNVVGAIEARTETLTVAARQSAPIELALPTSDTSLNRLGLRVSATPAGSDESTTLISRRGSASIEPPIALRLGNVPSREQIVLDIDASALVKREEARELRGRISIADASGRKLVTREVALVAKPRQDILSYEGLPVGEYQCVVSTGTDSGEVSTVARFNVPQAPEWLTDTLYDSYGGEDRVLLPWTPVEAGDRELAVWGRAMRWRPESILPASITSQGLELLASPMALVVRLDGRDHTVPLDSFSVTETKRSRASVLATGRVEGIVARVNMWMEYDGFLWMTLRLRDTVPGREAEAVRLVSRIPDPQATLYQTFSREHTGRVGGERIELPWLARSKESIANFYHWIGNEDRGLGFTYTSLEHWRPSSETNFCTLEPGANETAYRVNLVERPTSLAGEPWQLGIQATPIKPLPPDWHSMLTNSHTWQKFHAWRQIPENVDTLIIWPPNIMPGLNAPRQVDADRLQKAVDECHEFGVGALFTACPQKVSPVSKDFADYRLEWQTLPASILNWEGVPHYQNCGRSYTLRKWLFHGWARGIVEKFGMEGIYYDGWQTGQIACSNPHHGCGWVDEQGKRHVTVPVLEGREYNQRICMFLEDQVRSEHVIPETAPARAGFPQYHYRIHSWQFVPSVMGFATSWLTGEFTGYPLKGTSTLKPDGTFGKCLGLGRYRSLCLSTNWGVPNLFHTLIWEHTEDHPTDRQTLMAYAWFLPHGTPPGEVKYMNQKTVLEITRILMGNETRKARFTPGWRENPLLSILSPGVPEVMVATWDHLPARTALAVVSNLKTDSAETVRLRWEGPWEPVLKDARSRETIGVIDGCIEVTLEPESFVLLEARE